MIILCNWWIRLLKSIHRWFCWWLLVGELNVVECISIDWVFFSNRVVVILFYLINIISTVKSRFKIGPWKVHSSPYHSLMISWKSRSSSESWSLLYLFHRSSTLSMNSLYISKLYPNLSRRNNLKTPYKTVAYIGAGGVPIAIPLICG